MKNLKTEFLIIIFLWINILFSFINLRQANIFMIAGIAGLALVSVLYKFNRSLSILILAFLLAFGSINLISFNDSMQINFMGLFNIVNFLLFTILVYKNGNVLSALNEKWFGTSKDELKEQRKKRVQFFKKQFENLSTEDIKNKQKDNNLVREAKIALTEIIDERKLRCEVSDIVD